MGELTPEQIAEIRARCEAATEGPWVAVGRAIETEYKTVIDVEDQPPGAYPELQTGVLWGDNLNADLVFIAHARQDIPALLAALDEQAAEIARMRADAERWRKHERGVMRASERGMADLAALAALTQEATDE